MPTETTPFPITDQILADYNERGYWVAPKLFDEQEVNELRKEAMRVVQGENDFDCMHYYQGTTLDPESKNLVQVVNGWWVNARIRELLRHPGIGYIASRFMQSDEVRLFHDQILCKPGLGKENGTGANGDHPRTEEDEGSAHPESNVGWHQDYPHLTMVNAPELCSAWIALQDTDVEGGCMHFVAGSHKWGFSNDAATFNCKDMKALKEKFLETEGRTWNEEPCILEAGQISFHNGLIFHGSKANYKKEPRLCIVLNMMHGQSTYNKNGKPNGQGQYLGPYAKHGDPVGDPVFPKLWP